MPFLDFIPRLRAASPWTQARYPNLAGDRRSKRTQAYLLLMEPMRELSGCHIDHAAGEPFDFDLHRRRAADVLTLTLALASSETRLDSLFWKMVPELPISSSADPIERRRQSLICIHEKIAGFVKCLHRASAGTRTEGADAEIASIRLVRATIRLAEIEGFGADDVEKAFKRLFKPPLW